MNLSAGKPWEGSGLSREEWEKMMKGRYPEPKEFDAIQLRTQEEMIEDEACWEIMNG